MGAASLVLGILSVVFGVLPLFPLGPLAGTLTLYLAAVGLPLGAVGVCLGLLSRSDALVEKKDLGLHTAGLSTAVVGTVICLAWAGGLFYAQRKLIHAAEACKRDPRRCVPLQVPSRETRPPAPQPAGPVPL